jgi:hypothetical protein
MKSAYSTALFEDSIQPLKVISADLLDVSRHRRAWDTQPGPKFRYRDFKLWLIGHPLWNVAGF